MADDLVLITGGTGSFGHAYLRELLASGRRVRIISRDEEKQRAMARLYPTVDYVIGDVRDPSRVTWAMRGVSQVFHAAALKQVPQAEFNATEYVRTNHDGTLHVCAAARAAGARLVYLSTDKAVLPAGVMGMSKALGEAVVRNHEFNVVRYGNVLGSRGSIVPVWREFVASGRPVPITDPDMTRFVITLRQAIELVDVAMSSPMAGTVFVRKSPAATVAQLARVVAPGWPQTVIGPRPGEKAHEELVAAHEFAVDRDWYFEVDPTRAGGWEFGSRTAARVTDAELAELLEAA